MKEATTLLEAVGASLAHAADYNRDDLVAPAAVLWPDKERQWEALLPRLRPAMRHLLTFGEYDAASRVGPAVWIKCMIARALPDAAGWPADTVPVVYLPGVSRQELRAIEECAPAIQPLAELQYRGVFWTQLNAKDWTIAAFLQSKEGGLGLDVARDSATYEALRRALVKLADVPVESLRGKRLEADDFNALLMPDPARDLLAWMNDPTGTRARWDTAAWDSFLGICRERYKFDPEKDGEVVAAERLGTQATGNGPWAHVWQRFSESPRSYPKLNDLLRRAKPPAAGDLFSGPSPSWPQDNEQQEAELRTALQSAAGAGPAAGQRLIELDRQHAPRRTWVWCQLGESPMAQAVEYLSALVNAMTRQLGGASPQAMAEQYVHVGWQADAAVIDALACVRDGRDCESVTSVIQAIYRPWLERAAEHLQKVVADRGVPTAVQPLNSAEDLPAGCCILFVDGLRYDLGRRLCAALTRSGHSAQDEWSWAAMPTVTPTCKPVVSPIRSLLAGDSGGEDFRPVVAGDQKALTPDRFRQLLGDAGLQNLTGDETGDPKGRAWTEYGSFDHRGHDEGWKLAWRIEEEIQLLATRIERLLEAGWREVRIVTDHGWLLLPGGLPKVEMPGYLTQSRWGRCATLQQDAVSGMQVVPWFWNPDVRVALAPGIACFQAGMEYAHGSLSVQECVVPKITVRAAVGAAPEVQIQSLTWRGLACRVIVTGDAAGCRIDLRTKVAEAASTLEAGGQPRPIENGQATLYADDRHQGEAAAVVVLAVDGKTIAKQPTTVGG